MSPQVTDSNVLVPRRKKLKHVLVGHRDHAFYDYARRSLLIGTYVIRNTRGDQPSRHPELRDAGEFNGVYNGMSRSISMAMLGRDTRYKVFFVDMSTPSDWPHKDSFTRELEHVRNACLLHGEAELHAIHMGDRDSPEPFLSETTLVDAEGLTYLDGLNYMAVRHTALYDRMMQASVDAQLKEREEKPKVVHVKRHRQIEL